MKKRKAIIILIVMALLLGGLTFTAVEGIGTEKAGSAAGIKLGLDLAGGVSITYQVAGEEEPTEEDMADTIYKLQKRVENYSTEAQVYKEGSDRINIEIPGVSDEHAILQELGKPGSLVFMNSGNEEVLSGMDIADAKAGTQQDSMGNSQFVVQLTMTAEGRDKFAAATKAAYPTHDIIYIIYDGNVISAPAVQAEITDGQAVITGMGSYEEAENLASTIRIGGLKLELEELRSNVVGAQLGSEAISTSLKAGAVGVVLVVVFMIGAYYVMGAAASLALAIYTVLIVVLLNAFEITLTLPGIAGIILSIGMAVDANVVIFARIREELATGKTIPSAIKIGFERAMPAIIDSNITTLIAALVLGLKGSGTVKGFAQTLALGIILSMFTALFVTKLILNAGYAVGLKNVKLYGVGKERKTIDFLSKKVIFFAIPIIIIVAGFAVMGNNHMTKGSAFNYSLEFVGGTSTNVTFDENLSIADIDSVVIPLIEEVTGDADVQTQKVANTNQVIFKTRTLTAEERETLKNSMVEKFAVDESAITSETISSAISSEMQTDAVIAVVISMICILIYIWFRFKDIRFGASSVLALLHDALLVIIFYGVARIPVGGTFIACVLTIVGFSINATIVIFDRVRENLASAGKNTDLKELVNRSITQTLSRSVFTSLTVFLMILALYAFGVTSIKEFALPLMVGTVCGAYSSICLSGAMWYIFRTQIAKKAKAK
ncbi:MAG: protein translocase subunit SecD [Clostridiales bacterium]|nr:protein translocase subunit SecD [Clostridiales bacterium]